MKSCATCNHWHAAIIEVVVPGAQPHHARLIAEREAMLRATAALCTWPATPEGRALIAAAPPWLRDTPAAGGTLTDENDGRDCPCWQARPAIDIGRAA